MMGSGTSGGPGGYGMMGPGMMGGYGYYTIHILQEAETVGMLSVNASTGQVWVHSWHGELVEMSEHD